MAWVYRLSIQASQKSLFCIRRIAFWTVLICLVSLARTACADDTLAGAGAGAFRHSPFADIVRRVQPSVVSLSVSKSSRYEFTWDRRKGSLKRPASPALRYGSGIIIDTAGHILTNNHVIEGASGIQVVLSSGDKYPAAVIGQDPDSDLALVRLTSRVPLDSARVARTGNSDSVLVGDWVIAFGSPFGFHHTISVGVISAKGRHLDRIEGGAPPYQNFLQTDASINPGNSGGPLVDMSGRVIGINTAYNPGGSGIGFAIPINLAARVAADLRQHGEVVRGYLGIYPQNLKADIVDALGLSSVEGVLVGEVEPKSPADLGGIKRGDVILKLAGHAVTDAGHFLNLVAGRRPGERVEISILRGGRARRLSVVVGRRPFASGRSAPSVPDLSDADWPGLEVENRWSVRSRRLGILKTGQGVAVTYVVPGGAADREGIVPGDLILEIDGTTVWDVRGYRQIIKGMEARSKPLLFLLFKKDRGHTRFVALRPRPVK